MLLRTSCVFGISGSSCQECWRCVDLVPAEGCLLLSSVWRSRLCFDFLSIDFFLLRTGRTVISTELGERTFVVCSALIPCGATCRMKDASDHNCCLSGTALSCICIKEVYHLVLTGLFRPLVAKKAFDDMADLVFALVTFLFSGMHMLCLLSTSLWTSTACNLLRFRCGRNG